MDELESKIAAALADANEPADDGFAARVLRGIEADERGRVFWSRILFVLAAVVLLIGMSMAAPLISAITDRFPFVQLGVWIAATFVVTCLGARAANAVR